MGGSRLAGRDQPVLIPELVLEDREFSSEALDLTDELAILGGEDYGRDSGWRKANLAMRALLLAVVVGLTFGAGGALIWWLTSGGVSSSATRAAHTYLLDLKTANYADAYGQLCAPNESLEAYSARLAQARSHGHAITSFRLDAAFTKQTSHLKTAGGTVTFADGAREDVRYDLQPATSDGPSCLVSYDNFSG